jgi:hypothetical protein
VWGLVWVMILANILGAAILYPISGYMGRLAFLRGSLLIPPILVLAAVGAYLIRGLWQDVIVVVIFGFVGYAMKRWDYPRAPLILSFILGPLAETYLHKSISAWGGLFLLRPIVVVLMVLVVLSLAYSIWQTFKKKTEEKIESKKGEIIPAAILLILFTTAFFLSTQWTLKTRLFPQIIVIGGIIFSLWLVITEIRKGTYLGNAVGTPDPDFQTVSLRNEIIMTSWIILFLLMILVSGFWVAIALFTPLFMRLYGKESWKIVTTFTVCIWIGIFLVFGLIVKTPMFGGFLNLTWW